MYQGVFNSLYLIPLLYILHLTFAAQIICHTGKIRTLSVFTKDGEVTDSNYYDALIRGGVDTLESVVSLHSNKTSLMSAR